MIRMLAVLFLAAPLAIAADLVPHPATSPSPKNPALKACKFVTHDCEVCSVDKDGKVACTSAGLACVPKTWRCLEGLDN
jgi:hypothetical protein